MKIIGCNFHPSFQQIAMVDTETGEQTERRVTLVEAAEFYRELPGPVRVGMEACGNTLWFERLLAELGHELWLGDAGRIRATEVRKQKTDRRDAELLLRLMLENRFSRLWIPSQEQRDLRQLLIHRHKLVGMRRQVKNQLQHLALNQGVQQKRKLWTQAGRKLLERVAADGLDGTATGRAAETAGQSGPQRRRAGSSGEAGGGERCGGPVAGNASGDWPDHGSGVCSDAGRYPSFCA